MFLFLTRDNMASKEIRLADNIPIQLKLNTQLHACIVGNIYWNHCGVCVKCVHVTSSFRLATTVFNFQLHRQLGCHQFLASILANMQ